MRVLVIGGGGREHALAWKAARSRGIEKVYVAPGNAGTAREPHCENVGIAAGDISALLAFAQQQTITLTIVGPEVPLVNGIVNAFRSAGLACFGPSREAARLEGSKAFTKAFCERHGIPTARYRVFSEAGPAQAWARELGFPVVIKADGLAAGKGVVIAQTQNEVNSAVDSMLTKGGFGPAGREIVIEEFLAGEEASFMVLASGERYAVLATSQDHKRVGDNDTGPNTGGMGAYSPAPVVHDMVARRIEREIIRPALTGLATEGIPYTGFLYAGLMIDSDGAPCLLEFNCRMGDPETQPILMRLESDLIGVLQATLDGEPDRMPLVWDPRPALGVVIAAAGYPGNYHKGMPISGLENITGQDVKVFHAGTTTRGDEIVTSGGRVLCVTALGETIATAQKRAYDGVARLHFDGMQYRRDIGQRAL